MKKIKQFENTTKVVDLVAPNIYVTHRTRSESYPLHMHTFFEIEFFISGSAENIINGISHQIEPGSIYIYTPSVFHEIVNVTETLEYYYLGFDENMFATCNGVVELLDNLPYVSNIPFESDNFNKLLSIFKILDDEYQNDNPRKDAFLSHTLDVFFLIIWRLMSLDNAISTKANTIASSALYYIQKNFKSQITLGDIAEYSHCSENYLSSLFHRTYNKSINSYINDLRLTYAHHILLIEPNVSLTELCYNIGYKSYSHFSHRFKEKFGVSPKKIAKTQTNLK